MATLTGQYISQSYGGVVHLSTNTGIVTGSFTQLQDGLGINLGVFVNGQGSISGSFTGSLFGTASSAVLATDAANAFLLDNLDSTVFTLTSSFIAFTSSINAFSSSVLSYTASQNTLNNTFATTASFNAYTASDAAFSASMKSFTASFNAFSSSINSYTASQNTLNNTFATTASFNAFSSSILSYTSSLNNKTSSFATTGSNTFVGNQVISGSTSGVVKALTISSQTASMDLSTADLFTLTLVGGSTTFLNPTNIKVGQTSNLQITQATASLGTLTFASSVTFPNGFNYSATTVTSSIDLISFIAFNNSTLRGIPANQFI